MGKLFIVSNRLPVSVDKKKENLVFNQSAGGLATGLSSFHRGGDSLWVGWSGIPVENLNKAEREGVETRLKSEFNCHSVFLSREDIEYYYHGFCNKTIWPLSHSFTETAFYSKDYYESYKRVNEKFCLELLKLVGPGDVVWVHDYQLMLLPSMLREKIPGATIGFFLHIPFPPAEIFSMLPWRKDILRGLIGADLIGFHTFDYVQSFLESLRRLLGYENSFGRIVEKERVVKTDIFPMGIDVDRFSSACESREVKKEISRIKNRIGERKVILSVDRLDYTKGILNRLEAFDLFLEENPSYREKVALIMVAVPSRSRVGKYGLLKKQIDEYVGRINGKYGTIGWMPISYLYRFLNFPSLAALYCLSDVNLVTPIRDGMNLIAKEFVAAKPDGRGMLILSEQAGAAHELSEALLVNPNSREEIVEALLKALEMNEEEQKRRMSAMQSRLRRYNINKWASDFLNRLAVAKTRQRELCATLLTESGRKRLLDDYVRARKRLFLLDYDGTLVPFADRPENTIPDEELLEILKNLSARTGNKIVLISGRDRKTLERWFDGLKVTLAAEHGVWLKEPDGDWSMIGPLRNDWKTDVRPVLEIFVDRTPGSFIEEKEFSLAWHFRGVSPELASIRAGELKDTLVHLASNLDLGILEGSRVIEVKNLTINKGLAARYILESRKDDFVMAIGDDSTDEDLFAALPEYAYTIKVGLAPSRARQHLESVAEARKLLKEIERI